MSKKNYGATNRRKGHAAERKYAEAFRKIGFEFCKTSRQASRLHDDSCIDLVFIPFNVQIKAGKQRGLSPIVELKKMQEKIVENFPKDHQVHENPSIVIIEKEVGAGRKRTKYDSLVTLPFEDFVEIMMKDYGKYLKNDMS